MGQTIKHFTHSHFHISQSIHNSYSKFTHVDHPIIQLFVSSGVALCSFLVLQEYSKGDAALATLAALAGTSAFIIVGFIFESSSTGAIVLYLLAATLVFALAIASLSESSYLLIAAFVIHALVAENRIAEEEKGGKTLLHCWAVYNLSLALLLL